MRQTETLKTLRDDLKVISTRSKAKEWEETYRNDVIRTRVQNNLADVTTTLHRPESLRDLAERVSRKIVQRRDGILGQKLNNLVTDRLETIGIANDLSQDV